jgi:hypothetical protein
MTQISPHFTLEEFTDSQTAARMGIPNIPKGQDLKNVERVAEVMERVREILDNKPILISSGYRAPKVNAAVGGAKNSAHIHGLAADFTCPGFGTPKEICKKLEPYMRALNIDQLIYEYQTWTHLGLTDAVDPRHMALTIDTKGTRTGFA